MRFCCRRPCWCARRRRSEWTALQTPVLYGGSEPAMVVVPLMYNVIVYGAVAYERFYLRVRPFRVLVHAHLTAVAILPAMLEMESGGFAKSGGVLGWAAVSPFTAMVVLREKTTQLRYVGLFVTVVVAAIAHEVAWRVDGQTGRALFWSHSVETWPWQIYMYYVATPVGRRRERRHPHENAPGEVRERHPRAQDAGVLDHASPSRQGGVRAPVVEAAGGEDGRPRRRGGVRRRFRVVQSGGAVDRFGTNRRETFAERLLGPLLRAIMGDDNSDSGSRGAGGSSRTSSVVSFSQLCGSRSLGARGPGSADDDTHSAHSGLSRNRIGVDGLRRERVRVVYGQPGRQHSDAETSGSDVASVFERRSRKTGGSRAKSARVSFDAPPPLHVRSSARVKSGAQTVDRDVLGQLRSSASRGSFDKRSSSGVRARDHADVTVIFVDIVGFSDMCKRTRPIGVLRFLEHYFESLDKVAEEHGVTKVRTVGDGYLAVSGLMADMGVAQDAHRHVLRAMTFGLGVIQEIKDTGMLLADGQPLVVRVGIAHGPVFSGVVGLTCMQYDIFGDTPNMAARMEQTCPHDAVHMPAKSFEKMKADLGEALASEFEALRFETHKSVEIKNMGRVDTVSLAFRGNEESIERVLAGAIGDDDNRAVAAHIGVFSSASKWGSEENRTRRESHESHDASSEEGEGSEEDARYGGVSSELEDEASRRAEGEVNTTSRATSAPSTQRLVGISKDARPGASADVVVDVRDGAPTRTAHE